MRRLSKVRSRWRPELAYIIGVITTDGNLSSDKRHINITSKDMEMVLNAKKIMGLKNKIGKKSRGGSKDKKYFVLQFGNRNFYEFLLSLGLTAAKSKTLKTVFVPEKYFVDFFRGCIDGDGSISISKHPESSLPQLRIRLVSASPLFLHWLLGLTQKLLGVTGGGGGCIYKPKNASVSTLSFGKEDARKIIHLMYHKKSVPCLKRKRKIAERFLGGE